jgi:hypothetical protein
MDWKKLFSDPSTLVAIFTSGAIGLGVGIANGIIQKKHGGWSGFFGSAAVGGAVAVIVGLAVQDYIKAEALRLAIVGLCAVISEDIWQGLKTFGQGLRTDPLGAIARLIDALRGKSAAPPTRVQPDNGDPTPMRAYEEK